MADKIWVSIDKTTDVDGRYIVNVVIDRKAFYLKFWTKQAIP
jgi:hypothetical protein